MLFVSVGLRDVFTIVYFFGNRTFIIENYCVNKSRPEKKCNGKCYLADQLNHEKENNQRQIPLNNFVDHYQIKLLPLYPSKGCIVHEVNMDASVSDAVMLLFDSDYLARVEHPPQIG